MKRKGGGGRAGHPKKKKSRIHNKRKRGFVDKEPDRDVDDLVGDQSRDVTELIRREEEQERKRLKELAAHEDGEQEGEEDGEEPASSYNMLLTSFGDSLNAEMKKRKEKVRQQILKKALEESQQAADEEDEEEKENEEEEEEDESKMGEEDLTRLGVEEEMHGDPFHSFSNDVSDQQSPPTLHQIKFTAQHSLAWAFHL